MKPIEDVSWDDASEQHLWQSHQVTPDEIEEIILGLPGEKPGYRIVRDGDFYIVFGETGGGRLLTIVGEFVEGSRFRPFCGSRHGLWREAQIPKGLTNHGYDCTFQAQSR